MKLSLLALETLSNLGASPDPLSPTDLLEKSCITEHSRRVNAVILNLEEREIIYLIADTTSISSFDCLYGIRGIHDQRT